MRGSHRFRGAALAGNDLDERHAIDRVEEVQTHDTFGVQRARGDIGNRYRRRVGGKHGALPDPAFGIGKHTALDIEILDDRLDHDLGMRQTRIVERRCDEGHFLVQLALVDPAAFELAPPHVVGRRERSQDRVVVEVLEPHGDLAVGDQLGDPAAHDACAEHGCAMDLARRGAHVTRIALERGLALEQPDQVLRRAGRDQFADQPGLEVETLLQLLRAGGIDRLDRTERRRVVLRAGLGLGLLARLLQHFAA